MKPIALITAALSSLAGGAATIAVIRAISMGDPELSFVVAAVLGSQFGAIMHYRQPGAEPTTGAKATLGVVLAACAAILGTVLHLTSSPFTFVEISVPLAAIGSFVFPLVLFNTMWNALPKKDSRSTPTDP